MSQVGRSGQAPLLCRKLQQEFSGFSQNQTLSLSDFISGTSPVLSELLTLFLSYKHYVLRQKAGGYGMVLLAHSLMKSGLLRVVSYRAGSQQYFEKPI